MKNPLKSYKFWLGIVGGSILLVLAILIFFAPSVGKPLVIGATGISFFAFGIIRVVPLFKTLEFAKSKWLHLAEVIIDILIGAFLFFACIKKFMSSDNNSSDFIKFIDKYYRFFFGGVIYLRGVVYLISTVLFKEKTDIVKFWTHIGFITLGALSFGIDEFTLDVMSYVLAVICLLCGLGLVVDGGFNYGNYRKKIKDSREKKPCKNETETDGIKTPGINKDKIDEKDVPTEVIIDKDKQEDRTYIN